MTLNKNIDYGRAMKDLFEGLKYAENKVKSNDEYKYPNAYGRLSMAVKLHLNTCTDLSLDDIDKELYPETINDIPENLYTQSKTIEP